MGGLAARFTAIICSHDETAVVKAELPSPHLDLDSLKCLQLHILRDLRGWVIITAR